MPYLSTVPASLFPPRFFASCTQPFEFNLLALVQVYQRFVEIGRVALVNYGPDAEQLVTIIDVLDQNRVLVQGPSVHRQILNMKRVTLTDLKCVVGRQARCVLELHAGSTLLVTKPHSSASLHLENCERA